MGKERYPFDPTRQPVNIFQKQVSGSDVEAYFCIAKGTLKAAKNNPHEDHIGRFFGNLAPDHLRALKNSQGILEALDRQDVVQQGRTNKATGFNILQLNSDIALFLMQFNNKELKRTAKPIY